MSYGPLRILNTSQRSQPCCQRAMIRLATTIRECHRPLSCGAAMGTVARPVDIIIRVPVEYGNAVTRHGTLGMFFREQGVK